MKSWKVLIGSNNVYLIDQVFVVKYDNNNYYSTNISDTENTYDQR